MGIYEEDISLQITNACSADVSPADSNCCNTEGVLLPSCEEGVGFFNPLSSCYDGENELYASLLEGAFNSVPIPAVFYVISYDTSHDNIFGEDPTRKIIRKFNFNAYSETLPTEDTQFSTFYGGIEGMDQFPLFVSKKHFTRRSQQDYLGNDSQFPVYSPRGGEYVKLLFNGKYYEVITVKETDDQHLQRQNTYTLNLKVYEDDKASFISQTSASMVDDIGTVTNIANDIFDSSDIVDIEKEDILYQPDPTEEDPQDPFVGWD